MNLEERLKILTKEAESEYLNIMGHKPKYKSINLDKAKSRWGCCKHKKDGNHITIASRLVENYSDKEIKTTILHEFIHTEKDCHNHQRWWKFYARKFDQLGYNIQRCSNREEIGEPVEYKYQVKCSKCNTVIKRTKLCKVVQHPEWYRCGVCGGELKRI